MDFKYVVNTAAGKARHFTKAAVKKTGEAAELAKLKVAYISEKRKLERMFSTLGKLFYEQVKGTDVRVQIAAEIMEIDEQKAAIRDLKRAIVEAKAKNPRTECRSAASEADECCTVEDDAEVFEDEAEASESAQVAEPEIEEAVSASAEESDAPAEDAAE